MPKFVVTGGGTGGHIYPALAVAQALQEAFGKESVTYIGKTDGLESELVPQQGVAFEALYFYGMPRGKSPLLPFKLLKWLWCLHQAREIAKQRLKTMRPNVVFGTGGYVSAPVLLAAQALNIPYVVHEPDAKPGLVNQLLGKKAACITTSFSEGASALQSSPNQTVLVTGNPIRSEIGTVDKAQALERLGLDWALNQRVILVTGGSQGARRINQAVVEALPTLLNEYGLAVVHLTGKKLYEETLNTLQHVDSRLKNHPHYQVRPYASDMAALLAIADVAICRAGSLSLSEMYVSGIPTLLIPYPFAAADHQRKNAQASVKAGASLMLQDTECTGSALIEKVLSMVQHAETYEAMHQAAKALGHPDATAQIASCLKQFAK